MALTYKEIAEILKIVDASACDEVILELKGTKLVIRRGAQTSTGSGALSTQDTDNSQSGSSLNTNFQSSADTPKLAPKSLASSLTAEGSNTVHSPMVGTFYRRPSPEEEPFVREGDTIVAGQPLCLIEVMKLYTTH